MKTNAKIIDNLTIADFVRMKEMKDKMSFKEIASMFGVSTWFVWNAINNYSVNGKPKKQNRFFCDKGVQHGLKTKRVFNLVVGDCFKYYNTSFVVTHISGGRVYYKPTCFGQSLYKDSFGAKNQMKVEIIPSGSEESNMMLPHQPELEHDF